MRDNWIVCIYAMAVFLMTPLAAHSQTARGAAILLAGSPSAQANDAPQSAPNNFDRQLWLVDFHQLINELDTHYADLDWAFQDRHMNLPMFRRDTEEKLQQATDTQLARNAFEQFLDAFGDGHLSIDWPSIKMSTRSNAFRFIRTSVQSPRVKSSE